MHDSSLVTAKLLLTAREAAAILSISERTLWSLTVRGEIPVVRLGRSVRYSVEALRERISQMQGPTNAIGQPVQTAGR